MKKLLLSLARAAVSTFGHAQTPPGLTAVLAVHKVVTDSSGDKYLPTDQIVLDDVVQYTIEYTNTTKTNLSNIQIAFKIPKDMTFVATGLFPKPQRAQNQQAKWLPYPLMKNNELVGPSEYVAIQWVIPNIEPGKKFKISARAKLSVAPTKP